MSKHSIIRWGKIMGTYLLVAAVAALGWLWCALPEEVYLEPEQTLTLPRFFSFSSAAWAWGKKAHSSKTSARTAAASRCAARAGQCCMGTSSKFVSIWT